MAKLYFKYGTMNSGKSMELLKVAHNYEEQGKKIIILSPSVGNRTEHSLVGSRIGWARASIPIYDETDVFHEVQMINDSSDLYCVLVDEAQFLNKQHVFALARIVDELSLPVMAFGLKNDFRNEIFEGSYYLLALAESIEEIKTICWYCDRKANMVVKYEDGKVVREGEQIVIDNEESRQKQIEYRPVCRKCYNSADSLPV